MNDVQAVLGWGARASGRRAEALAIQHQLPCYRLEDGFLRSFHPGQGVPGLSLVVDTQGIFYDATRPSDLEVLLASESDLLEGIEGQVEQAIELLLANELSKYNHAPCLPIECLRGDDHSRVLVVDQTDDDVSVRLGMASEKTFHAMVDAALAENPQATIYIKTHPEVSNGSKRGYLSQWPAHPRIVMLHESANPINLLTHMDSVYVVSSTFGFEALFAGKQVSVFGVPWYAGWGVTDDRQHCQRRVRTRSVKELFAAGYFHYTRYLNPATHKLGTIFDVIHWLILQKAEERRLSGRIIGVGFRAWKAANLAPLLSISPERMAFVKNAKEAATLGITSEDSVLAWGRDAPEGVDELIASSGAMRWRLEDGFIRSVGLGAHMVPPLSLVLDSEGIYFDPSQPSTLEHLLATTEFSEQDCTRARYVRQLIVEHGLTKYNVERRQQPRWLTPDQEVVLVPGQVEDDASIRYGTTVVSTNLALLKAARDAHPNAFVVYKPHPDVLYAKRKGNIATARQWADHIETECSVVNCLEHCDFVHTMTSLAGFEGLLRNKHVVTYGEPFYAGWGLTEDWVAQGKALYRRQRTLTLDELVAGTLLHYPRYWDPILKGFTTCESVLTQIIAQRRKLELAGKMGNKKLSYLHRQWLKLRIIKGNK
jgi:capsular polysaccharide export protein